MVTKTTVRSNPSLSRMSSEFWAVWTLLPLIDSVTYVVSIEKVEIIIRKSRLTC